MGKACTKHLIEPANSPPIAKPSERQRTKPQALQHLLKLNESLGLDQPIKPPHNLRSVVHELSKVFKFYVCICGLRLKHVGRSGSERRASLLHSRSLGNHTDPSVADASSSHFVSTWRSSLSESDTTEYMIVIDWDDGFLSRRTGLVKCEGGQVVFRDSFFFHWSVDSLPRLSDSKLVLTLYVVEHGRVIEELSCIELDIFTIATGPVHTDLPLCNAQRTSRAGAITTESRHRCRIKDARLQLDVRMSQICELLITPVEIIAHVDATVDSAAPGVTAAGDNSTLGSTSSTGPGSASHLDMSPQVSLSISDGASPAPLRSKSVTELDKVRQSVLSPPASEAPSKSGPLDDEESEGHQIERAAAGGHSGDDDRRPILAEWQIDYAPTGIVNSSVFASSWTGITAAPMWSAIQGDQDSTSSQGGASAASICPPAPARSPVEKAEMDVRRSVSSDVAPAPWKRRDTTGSMVPSLSPCCETEPDPGFEMPDSRSLLMHSSTSKGLKLQPISQRDDSMSTAPSLDQPLPAPRMPISAASRLPGSPFSQLRGWNHLVETSGVSTGPSIVCSLPSGISAQQKYVSLAAVCRTGKPLNQMLQQSVFPTIYLTTTGDSLRQYHIHLRLWARHLGVGSSKLFGETWVPFFKLYEADVVDQGDQYFYDARFCETLWQEGRSVGKLEGLIVFQNSPMIRQMMAGVHTELGFSRIAMPIIGELTEYENARKHLPREVLQLSLLQSDLTNILYSRSNTLVQLDSVPHKKTATTTKGLQETCDQIYSLLTNGGPKSNTADATGFRATFLYTDLPALVTGQRILLELAKHVLDSIDQVPWHVRGSYGSILSALMRRAELDMGNLLPRIPECATRMPELDLRSLTRLARRLERDGAIAQTLSTSTQNAEESRSPTSAGGGKSPARIMHVLSIFRGRPVRLKLRSGSRRQITERDFDSKDSAAESSQMPILSLSSRSTDTRDMDTALEDLSLSYTPRHKAARSTSLSREASLSTVEQAPAEDGGRNGLRRPSVSLSADEVQDLVTFHKRMKVARLYAVILLRLRRYCLGRICSEALFESQRRNVCLFLALLYTRLPSFRESLLAHVLTPDERGAILPGWRGHDFDLDRESLDEHDRWLSKTSPGLYELQLSFDWSPFHRAVKDYFGHEAEEALLLHEPNDAGPPITDWENKLCRPRGILFFTFLENWARTTWHMIHWQRRYPAMGVESGRAQSLSRGAMTIRWDLLPGYASMLKAFLIEMRTRPIAKFPDALLNCSGALLANDKLLSVFVRIVLSRTSVFSREQVFAVFNYLDFWLEVLSVTGRPISATFDFRFVCKAIEVVITSDLALQTAKGLWFMYKRMDLVGSQKMLPHLIDLLIYRRFHDLILNWSWLVRKCFISLLLYRICEQTRRIVAKFSDPKANKKPTAYLSIEDRLMCWAYVLLSRNLQGLNLPNVFPDKFLDTYIRQILAQPLSERPSPFDSSPPGMTNTLIWTVPIVLPTTSLRSPNSTILDGFTSKTPQPSSYFHDDHTRAAPHTTRVAPSVTGFIDPNEQSSVGGPFSSSRAGWTYRQGLKRLRRRRSNRDRSEDDFDPADRLPDCTPKNASLDADLLDDNLNLADPYHFLPPPLTMSPKQLPYHKAVRKEFEKELSSYKVWVISRATEIPAMHIPASPLDTNVEVPLDDD